MTDPATGDLSGLYFAEEPDDLINLESCSRINYDGKKFRYTVAGETGGTRMDPTRASAIFNALAQKSPFVPIGEDLVNIKSVQTFSYDGKKLRYHQAGDDFSEKMNPADRDRIYAQILKDDRFLRIGDDIVNMNTAATFSFARGGWLSNDRLKIEFVGDHTAEIDMTQDRARDIIAEAAKRRHFRAVGGSAVNLMLAGAVSPDSSGLKLAYPGGDKYVEVSAIEASDFIGGLGERDGFIQINGQAINQPLTGSAEISSGLFGGHSLETEILGNTASVKGNVPDLSAVFAKMASSEHYLVAGEKAVNIHTLASITYDGKKLRFHQGTDEEAIRMDESRARAIIDKVGKLDKFIPVGDALVNASLAAEFRYDGKKMHYVVGREEYDVPMDATAAGAIINKVKAYGTAKAARNEKAGAGAETLLDADYISNLYEEMDAVHSSMMLTNIIVMTTIINANNASNH